MKKSFWVALWVFSVVGCMACDDDSNSQTPLDPVPNPPVTSLCGNGIVEGNEVCDLAAGLPRSCLAWDATKQWREGGSPMCAMDCSSVVQGTCVEDVPVVANCNNGLLETGEICDGAIGVPTTCSAYDPKTTWKEGGKPACASDCRSIQIGTCTKATEGESTDPNILDTDEVTTQRCNLSSSDYEESCTGNVAHFCSEDGFVVNRDCDVLSKDSAQLSCQVASDGGYADCVSACDSSVEQLPTTCTGKYVTYHICEKTQSGGNYLYTYTDDTPCPIACDGGKCVSTTSPVPGSACDTSFETQCFGGNGYECVGGKIVETPCTAGTSCAMRFGAKTFQCAETCSVYDIENNSYGCQNIDGKQALNNRVCEVASDAKYYWFTEMDVCKSSCNKGVCDVEIPKAGSACDPSTMNNVCAHNSAYYCDYTTNKVVVMECGVSELVGYPVCRYRDEYFADCTFPCEPGTEPIMQCGGSNKKGTAYTDNILCEKALDGTYYYFNAQESCPNGCKNGVCL